MHSDTGPGVTAPGSDNPVAGSLGALAALRRSIRHHRPAPTETRQDKIMSLGRTTLFATLIWALAASISAAQGYDPMSAARGKPAATTDEDAPTLNPEFENLPDAPG